MYPGRPGVARKVGGRSLPHTSFSAKHFPSCPQRCSPGTDIDLGVVIECLSHAAPKGRGQRAREWPVSMRKAAKSTCDNKIHPHPNTAALVMGFLTCAFWETRPSANSNEKEFAAPLASLMVGHQLHPQPGPSLHLGLQPLVKHFPHEKRSTCWAPPALVLPSCTKYCLCD